MPMIRETIVSTTNESGQVHLAPIGLIAEGDAWIIAPFHPSTTLSNLRSVPFRGFNRAQAAVIEAAILVSRLRLLPRERIEREMAYLQSAITKTASTAEEEAWHWLID